MMTALLFAAALNDVVIPHKLCGRTYSDRAQLYGQIRRDARLIDQLPAKGEYDWFEERAMTAWWVHMAGNRPDYIICLRRQPTGQGHMRGRVEGDCGKEKSACTTWKRKLARIKF